MEKDCHNKMKGRVSGHQEGDIYVPKEIILMTLYPCVFRQDVGGRRWQEEFTLSGTSTLVYPALTLCLRPGPNTERDPPPPCHGGN